MIREFVNFIDNSPTSYNAILNLKNELLKEGYIELFEDEKFNITKGNKYFLKRNNSSIIAFNIPSILDNPTLMITASHADCPSLKLKPNSVINTPHGSKLDVEIYGGANISSWLDRVLSIAGRIIIKQDNKIKEEIFDYQKGFCLIPSNPIHLDRSIREGKALNPQIDMCPLVTMNENFNLYDFLSSYLGINSNDILASDLYLYPIQKAYIWGENDEFISSYHIDNLECTYSSFKAFINNFNDNNINMYCCFDNEEVGSNTRQGALADFYSNTINRIADCLKLDYYTLLANSMILSCDNSHGVNPNHVEIYDSINRPEINKGIVIKLNARQSYTTDSLTTALFKEMISKEDIPYQYFANRSDLRGGSTLGNAINEHISLLSIDIGLPMLSMHSCLETTGTLDYEYMINAIKSFYQSHLRKENGSYIID